VADLLRLLQRLKGRVARIERRTTRFDAGGQDTEE
jgi:hypothetical protein